MLETMENEYRISSEHSADTYEYISQTPN